MIEVGVDIERVDRFKGKTLEEDSAFLQSIFTDSELKYSFSNGQYAQHLCARFCAKEAVIKTLNKIESKNLQYTDIEILNNQEGCPYVNLNKCVNSNFKLSLSHTKDYAVAFVVRTN